MLYSKCPLCLSNYLVLVPEWLLCIAKLYQAPNGLGSLTHKREPNPFCLCVCMCACACVCVCTLVDTYTITIANVFYVVLLIQYYFVLSVCKQY